MGFSGTDWRVGDAPTHAAWPTTKWQLKCEHDFNGMIRVSL